MVGRLGLIGLIGLSSACYSGPGLLEPEPGTPGGQCLEPEGLCEQFLWQCEPAGRYCYDPADPCRGVLCGGNGQCSVDDDTMLPVCTCDFGFQNQAYALYCEPL